MNSKGENVSHPEEYDVVVLGSGRARSFAWSLASQGKRVAVVERRNLAGSCPTIACAPSKNVIQGAKVANYFRRGAEFGIAAGDWKVEMPAVRDRKREMVEGIVALNVQGYRESGAELVKGQGRFVGPRTIEVTADDGRRTLRGEVVVVCTGSRARIDPIPGLAESRPMTHIEALELDRVPRHLLVLGGGYVGLELAQALRRFGSRVTVIERNDALAYREDRDVSEALRELFDAEGIEVLTATPVARVEGRSGESVRLHAMHGVIEGSDLLVASGRTPNTDGIGLETAGIERDDRGFIEVDERLRTTAAGVWAVGDCAGSPHFTHIADDDVRVIRGCPQACPTRRCAMRSWSTRRWRKGSPRVSARCPPGPDVVWTDPPARTSCPAPSRWAGAGAGVEVAGELVRDRAEDRRVGAAELGEPAVALEDMV